MSLDVHITLEGAQPSPAGTGIFVRENGQTREISRAEWDEKYPGREPVVSVAATEDSTVYHGNITHNLSNMASHAGLYHPLWRPEELGITRAADLIDPLAFGLGQLVTLPEYFRKYSPENGWGTYETLVEFVTEYLEACKKYPQGKIDANR